MEKESTINPDYQKGFNEGYMIKKHLSELADKLEQAIGHSARSDGFRDGSKQAVQEKAKERRPEWLRSERISNLSQSIEKAKDKERDLDDLDER